MSGSPLPLATLFTQEAARPATILHVAIDLQRGRCEEWRPENRAVIRRVAQDAAPAFKNAGIDTAWVYLMRRDAPSPSQEEAARDLVPEIAVAEGDLLLRKSTSSAFGSTAFTDALATRNVSTLLLSGFYGWECVRETARDAGRRGYNTILLTDCTNRLPEDGIDLRLMREAGVRTATLGEIAALLPPARPEP